MLTLLNLYKEIGLLKEDIKNYRRGLIIYDEVQKRLDNISVLIEQLLTH